MCKQFYVDTLDIAHSVNDTALNARKPFTRITDNDQRGKHENRPNRVPAAVIDDIKSHINSFPRFESHYCRKSSTKEYLEANLNLTKLYNEYEKHCESMNLVPATESVYRHIFNTQFDIGFHSVISVICVLIIASKKAMKSI